jgi:hypothetical protein
MDNTLSSYQIVLEKLQFSLLDYSSDLRTIYAKSTKSNTVHIINNHLIKYYAKRLDKARYSEEFSYKVAENTEEFYLFRRKGLLPRDFYHYYKVPLKIINHSSFSITSLKRKVFLLPFVFNLDGNPEEPHLVNGAIYADKVEKGETVDQALKRIVSKELKISQDYVRAGIAESVDYDVDNEGKLIPRLNILMFIRKDGQKNPQNNAPAKSKNNEKKGKEGQTIATRNQRPEVSVAERVIEVAERIDQRRIELEEERADVPSITTTEALVPNDDRVNDEFLMQLHADMEKLSIITDLSVERKEDLLRLVKDSANDTKENTLTDIAMNLRLSLPLVEIDTIHEYKYDIQEFMDDIQRTVPGFSYQNLSARYYVDGIEKTYEELTWNDDYDVVIDALIIGDNFYCKTDRYDWDFFFGKINEITAPKLGYRFVKISDGEVMLWLPIRNDMNTPENVLFVRQYMG